MPYHILFDTYEEARLAGKSFGSTKSGIAPFYSDKYAKIGFQVNELFGDEKELMDKIENVCTLKNVMLEHLYHQPALDPKEFAVAVSPFHNLHHSITFRIISFIMILLFFLVVVSTKIAH